MVVAQKSLGIGYKEALEMPYWLLMVMLIDNNILHERPEKEDKDAPKKLSGMGMAGFMK